MTLKEHEISHFDYTKYFFCYFVLGNIYALGGPENFGFINGKKTQVTTNNYCPISTTV